MAEPTEIFKDAAARAVALSRAQQALASFDGGGGGGYDGKMEARVKKIEDDLGAIKTDIAVIKATQASKSDVSEAKVSIILWVVATVFIAQILPAIVKLFAP